MCCNFAYMYTYTAPHPDPVPDTLAGIKYPRYFWKRKEKKRKISGFLIRLYFNNLLRNLAFEHSFETLLHANHTHAHRARTHTHTHTTRNAHGMLWLLQKCETGKNHMNIHRLMMCVLFKVWGKEGERECWSESKSESGNARNHIHLVDHCAKH